MKKIGIVSQDFVDKNKARFEEEISKLSEADRNIVLRQRAEVDAAIEEENRKMDLQAETEAKMREATGLHHVDVERLMEEMAKTPVGETYVFVPKYSAHKQYKNMVPFTKTPYNTIVPTNLYVSTMQDTVLKLSDALFERQVPQSNFTNLGFLGLIKLAFKNLLKRGN